VFQAAELGRCLSKADFDIELPTLRADLLQGQLSLMQGRQQALLVIIEGLDGSGRAELLNRLYAWLDPRGLKTYTFWDPSDEEQERPFFWRFWRALPQKGGIAIHLGGWYRDLLTDAINEKVSDAELELALEKRRHLEQMMALEGISILKFWLYLPEKVQRERLSQEDDTPDDRWGNAGSKRALKSRPAFLHIAEHVMRLTDSAVAPWYLVEATDANYRDMTVGKTIANALLNAQQSHQRWTREAESDFVKGGAAPNLPNALSAQRSVLDSVDLGLTTTKADYKKAFDQLRKALSALAWQAWRAKKSTVIVFEGWDAAGKGGAIRRLASALDARLYRAVSYGAPTEQERDYPYLWRFWHELPRAGRVMMFDRSWYGRVLVERVEGFADTSVWSRAYHEINHFESELVESGIVLIKFWLHISPDMQLQRFKERESTPYKQHKITDEDWRNREKWSAYEMAVNDMVFRTGTEVAPWTLVSAEDKYSARLQVLSTVIEQLKQTLGESGND
jgi:polyphosphate:AMP phosphotransferase